MNSLTSLETIGALSARYAHALSNQLTIVTGNLCVAAASFENREKLAAAIKSAIKGANAAGELTARFVALRRGVGEGIATAPLARLREELRSWTQERTEWSYAWDVGNAERLELGMPPAWLIYSFEAIGESGSVTISDQGGKVRAILKHPGTAPIDWHFIRTEFTDFGRLTAYELLAQAGALPETTAEGDRLTTTIPLPIFER